MKNRLIAVLLVVSTLLPFFEAFGGIVLSVKSAEASPYKATVTVDGREEDSFSFPQSEKKEIKASLSPANEDAKYQWQICADIENNLWVDIYTETLPTLNVSYPLLRAVLDGSGSAYLRAEITADDVTYTTAPICATVLFEPELGMSVIPNPAVSEYEASEKAAESAPSPASPPALASAAPVFGKARSAGLEAALAANEEEDSADLVTITIQYLDQATEKVVYSPYTATVEKTMAFSQAVVSPTLIGYAPFLRVEDANGNVTWQPAETYYIDYKDGELTDNVVIKLFYRPIEVPYTVKYFFQETNSDLYVERTDLQFTGKALTGTVIADDVLGLDPKITTGFTKLYHYPEAVAADGSTVFQCYYDRNYYMIKFDMNGGYGVEPIYARYGTTYSVNTPVRTGYVFDGWDLLTVDTNNNGEPDRGDGIPDTLPYAVGYGNVNYKAVWKSVETTFTYVYWKENANDNGYTYWGSEQATAKSGDYADADDAPDPIDLKKQYENSEPKKYTDAEHFTTAAGGDAYNRIHSDHNVIVKGDGSTVVNVYYLRNNYTLTFVGTSKNECQLEEHSHSDSCYYFLCGYGQEHTHVADCIKCGKTEHIHNAECCSFTEHTHSEENGCKLACKHEHSESCYGGQSDNAGNPSNTQRRYFNQLGLTNGSVYRVYNDRTDQYFLYFNGSWYTTLLRAAVLTEAGSTYSGSYSNRTYYVKYELEFDCRHTHDTNCYDCEIPEHTHGEGYCNGDKCGQEAHSHSAEENCYSCGFSYSHTHTDECRRLDCHHVAHTHSNACNYNVVYEYTAKYDSDISHLWTDTNLPPKQYLQNYCVWESSVTGYYYSFLQKMPEQDVTMTVYDDWKDESYTYSWDYWLEVFDGIEDTVYVDYPRDPNNKYYKYLTITVKGSRNLKLTYDEDYFPLTGYIQEETSENFDGSFNGGTHKDLYYSLDTTKTISFDNYGEPTWVVKGIPFMAKLNDLGEYAITDKAGNKVETLVGYEPPYPDALEPGAYDFVGWYDNPSFVGEPANFETLYMKSENMKFYAKWELVSHTVRFFDDKETMLKYEADPDNNGNLISREYTVEHGNVVGQMAHPVREGYVFSGWFHDHSEAGDTKKIAYAALDTPITHDMNVYAEWTSDIARPYVIHYAIEAKETDEAWLALLSVEANSQPKSNEAYTVTNGSETRRYIYVNDGYHLTVADDTAGHAFQGTTRTFEAKSGAPLNQLYADYNQGYFPTFASHSLVIQPEEDGTTEPVNNVYTFLYVMPQLPIKYTVRYIDRETGLPVKTDSTTYSDKVVWVQDKAVVTERFQAIDGYISDAFYKRLILSVKQNADGTWVGDDKQNVITFYYTKNETSAFFTVNFMLQKLGTDGTNYSVDGSGHYEKSSSSIESIATIGETIPVSFYRFEGFNVQNTAKISADGNITDVTMDAANRSFDVTISKSGTEIYIFYSRDTFDVTVEYRLYNTGEKLSGVTPNPDVYNNKQYGDAVHHTAPLIVESDNGAKYALVNAENTVKTILVSAEAGHNVIVYYYTELQYTVEYKIIGDVGGTLSSTIEVRTSTGSFGGSSPTPALGYRFIGWYLDEAGTVSVGEKATVTGTSLVPNKDKLDPMPTTNVFYAKFELITGNLTIKRENASDEGNGDQVFVYKITDSTDASKVYYVSVRGNGSVTVHGLPCVTYTVEQVNDWSWRYRDASQTVALTESGATVTFDDAAAEDKWLNGNSTVVQNIKK